MGYENRRARPQELESMKFHLSTALQQGAWGLSSGLIYVPSSFSDAQELGELAAVVAGFGGIYSTHMRGEGDSLLEALQEAVSVARQSGVKLQISHLKASGEKNWSKMDSARDIILGARQEGIDVACDHYPYCASSTSLESVMPPWIREGGLECFLRNLRDPHLRARAAGEMERSRGWNWSKVILSSPGRGDNSWMQGKSVREVSELRQMPPGETIMDLLLQEEGDISIFNFAQSEDTVIKVMGYPFSMVGSDAAARSPSGPLAEGLPHPRAYGTFPRILGHYVRERGILTIEEAIRKMTSIPAQRLGLSRRGLIREGWWGDIVVLDPEKIGDTSTYTDPHRYPDGIEYVIVNGEVIVERGSHTGALPGRVLRRGRDE
jgi:N-acyl-D-amino-acid deacylase